MPDTVLPLDANGHPIPILGQFGPNEDGTATDETFTGALVHQTSFPVTSGANFDELEPGGVYEVRWLPQDALDVSYYRWAAKGATAPTATASDLFIQIGAEGTWRFTAKDGQEQLALFVNSVGAGNPNITFSIARLR